MTSNVTNNALGSLAQVYAGLVTSRRTTDDAPPVPVINVSDLDGSGSVAGCEQLSTLPLEPGPALEAYQVQPDDVLLTSRGTVLKVALVGPETAGAVLSGNLIGVRVTDPRLVPAALVAWLLTPAGQATLTERFQSSSGLLALTSSTMKALPIPLPPLSVQKQIVAVFEATRTTHRAALQAAELRRTLGLAAVADLFRSSPPEK